MNVIIVLKEKKYYIIVSVISVIVTLLAPFIPKAWDYFTASPSLSIPPESFIEYSNKTITLFITNEAPYKTANNVVIEGLIDNVWTKIFDVPQIPGGNKQVTVPIKVIEKTFSGASSFSYIVSCPEDSKVKYYNGGNIIEINYPISLTNIINQTCYGNKNFTSQQLDETVPDEYKNIFFVELKIRISCKDCPRYYFTTVETVSKPIGTINITSCKLRLCNATLCSNSDCLLKETASSYNNTYLEFIPFQNT